MKWVYYEKSFLVVLLAIKALGKRIKCKVQACAPQAVKLKSNIGIEEEEEKLPGSK